MTKFEQRVKESRHLREQWFVVPLPWDDSGCTVVSGSDDPHAADFVCSTEDVTHIDEFDGVVTPPFRSQEDAQLIAAAPSLLKACAIAYRRLRGQRVVMRNIQSINELRSALIEAGFMEKGDG